MITPGFDYLADRAIAHARTVGHGLSVGLTEVEARTAIGDRLSIDAGDGRATDWALLCDHLTALADEKSRKDRAMATVDEEQPDHDCPGGCGKPVPHHRLACPNCWFLLPLDQRNAIQRAKGTSRLRLVGEAVRWYRQNVRRGELTPAATSNPAPRITIADKFGGHPR